MSLLHWHNSFNVGVSIVDEQHKKLLELINRLSMAVTNKATATELNAILEGILNYTEMHFRTEEGLFAIHPSYSSHCKAHENFENELKSICFTDLENNHELAANLLENVQNWLKAHILKVDIECFEDLGFRQDSPNKSFKDRLDLLNFHDKVLIVEDEATQFHLLKKHLERGGFSVIGAKNGIEALDVIKDNYDLHLIITDLKMPEMDGFEFIKQVRRRYSDNLYIIVITSSKDRDSLIQSFELGANDYLQKPLFPQELMLRLKNGQRQLRLQSQDELIFSIAKLADYRSPETGKHLERVKEFTHLLGLDLVKSNTIPGLTEGIVNDISMVSRLHDIGKVGIEDRILNKPGKLSDEEFHIMKGHCKIGGDLIGNILRKSPSKTLRLAYEITMYHHEKWDGSGYPLGLTGEDIPLAARIMAVADVYDALTTERVYKAAFSREKAREIILKSSGSHFAPAIVAAFENVEGQFHLLRTELTD